MQDYEDAIEKGSFYRVNLSTRITQDACKKLAEIQGWLQTERQLCKVSKQEAIEKAILHYHAHIMHALEMHDESTNEIAAESDQANVINLQDTEKPKAIRQINLDQYRDMTKLNGGGFRYGG
jgi:hypothetical protein